MKMKRVYIIVGAVITAMVFAPFAYGDSPLRSIGKSIRTSRSGALSHGLRSGLSGSRLSGNRGRNSSFPGISRGLSQLGSRSQFGRPFGNTGRWGGNTPSWNSFGNLGRYSGYGYGGMSNHGWNNGYRYGSGYGYGYDPMAKAYRDVGIANALVGLVGVMATVSQNAQYPPVATVAPAPSGYWQRQNVIVEPQRYEQYQEWIPELYDQRTGQKVGGGYYESRTRLIPEVVQQRDVWVTR